MKKSILIDADISKVWNALINSDLTERYAFGLRVSSDWKVGSSVLWKGTYNGREIGSPPKRRARKTLVHTAIGSTFGFVKPSLETSQTEKNT